MHGVGRGAGGVRAGVDRDWNGQSRPAEERLERGAPVGAVGSRGASLRSRIGRVRGRVGDDDRALEEGDAARVGRRGGDGEEVAQLSTSGSWSWREAC